MKVLKENTGVNSCDLGLNNGFLDITPEVYVTKEKIGKLDFMKVRNFYALKDTIKKVKRQPIKWEKTYVRHICDKGLVSRI